MFILPVLDPRAAGEKRQVQENFVFQTGQEHSSCPYRIVIDGANPLQPAGFQHVE